MLFDYFDYYFFHRLFYSFYKTRLIAKFPYFILRPNKSPRLSPSQRELWSRHHYGKTYAHKHHLGNVYQEKWSQQHHRDKAYQGNSHKDDVYWGDDRATDGDNLQRRHGNQKSNLRK